MALEDPRQSGADRPAGVLWPAAGGNDYVVERDDQVPDRLAGVVRHLWSVRWQRPAASSFRPQVLTHPISHLTVEEASTGRMHGHALPAALIHGLVTRIFTNELPSAGRVTGVAFHPGAVTALVGTDARSLTDRVVPAAEVLGSHVDELARGVVRRTDEAERRSAVLALLADLPGLDRAEEDLAYATVRRAVELMRSRRFLTLAPVAEQVNVAPRTLQRMFARYVGASPLWVLRRYRLQDAAAAIDAGHGEDLAGLAVSLGFTDHAHFTRSFTAVIGVSPSAYRRSGGGSR